MMFKTQWNKRAARCLAVIVLAMGVICSSGTTGYASSTTGPGINMKAPVSRPSTNGVTIYVSKNSSILTLKQHGVEIGTYPVTMGAESSAGTKSVEGDLRTPSGEFYICTRNDKSIAYLSLGLSYPTVKDAERGYADGIISEAERDAIITAHKEKKQPPWDTALGGAIMIHGCREDQKPTHGCVAVDNSVMDVLWSYCNLGVPVTVGP
mgnify:FL=1